MASQTLYFELGKFFINFEHLWFDTSITSDCTEVNGGPKLSKTIKKQSKNVKKAKWSILAVETGDFDSGFVVRSRIPCSDIVGLFLWMMKMCSDVRLTSYQLSQN